MPSRVIFSTIHLTIRKDGIIMYVYVINKHGQPIMPCKPQKARVLLQEGKATVVKQVPFTIKLLYGSSSYKQPVSLGMDAGSRHIGIAVITAKKVLYAEELKPRNDVVKLLSTRRQNRRTRRNHLRYRQARFDNRVHSKHKGWLAPSVEVKIQEHLNAINRIMKILPITEIHIETAEFDTQRLKAMENGKPLPVGEDYQKGEMYDSFNARQYVLKRDNYTCQCCNKHKEIKLHVHHIETRKIGSNSPNNLITLCKECHEKVHKGMIRIPTKKKNYRDAAFMGIMRNTLISRAKEMFDVPVTNTYGYITKYYRETYNIEKSHINDAIIISKNFKAKFDGEYYQTKAVRHHNRQIHKANFIKGGRKKLNQAHYLVKELKLFDTVEYQDNLYFVFGRRQSGFMDIRTLDGTKVNKGSISYKKIKYINSNKGLLVERRKAIPLVDKSTSFLS